MSAHNAYVNSVELRLRAAELAQDKGCAHHGHTFYDVAIRDAVRELCYDAPYDVRAVELPIPDSRIIDMPAGMSDNLNLFLFQGERCSVGAGTRVFLKENYSHHGGDGFFANQKGINVDPLIGDTFWYNEPPNMYYGNIINGKLYLSPQCKQFTSIRIEYVGLGSEKTCDMPRIPTWAFEALSYRVAMLACEARIAENAQLFGGLAKKYEDKGTISNPRSAWVTAMMRWRRMSEQQRRDTAVYDTTFGNHRVIR